MMLDAVLSPIAQAATFFDVPLLPAGCPWSDWTPPNLKWCEDNLCAWITTPANTWSNLAYILLGILMWRQANQGSETRLRLFGPASIAAGACSFAYHASYTFFFQFFDFVGMFIFCFVLIVLNWERMGRLREGQLLAAFLAGVGVCSALVPILFWLEIPIQITVVVLILMIISQEWRLSWQETSHGHYPIYFVGLALLTAGAICSALDLSHTWCDPSNHWLQGHALWHLLTACCLYVQFVFYRRLFADQSH